MPDAKTKTKTRSTPRTDTVATADRLRPILLKLSREVRREARDVGVTPEQVALLVTIKYAPGIGVRDLAAHERVSPPAMSNQVDRLARDGLVQRTPNTEDKRRVGLTLTDDGQRVLRKVRSRRTAWLATRLNGLTDDELQAIDAAIDPLWKVLPE